MGCFSSKPLVEGDDAPVEAPASPVKAETEAPVVALENTEEGVVEAEKEAPLVDVSEPKEEAVTEAMAEETAPVEVEAEAEVEAEKEVEAVAEEEKKPVEA